MTAVILVIAVGVAAFGGALCGFYVGLRICLPLIADLMDDAMRKAEARP